jgi:hypothetical protein
MKSRIIIKDGKLYEVLFSGEQVVSVSVKIDRLRGIHREDFWRSVWDLTKGRQSRNVVRIIELANLETKIEA